MKISKYVKWIILSTVVVVSYLIYKNQTGTVSEILGNNLGFIPSIEGLNESLQSRKLENLRSILLQGGIILVAEIIVFFYFKSKEDKLDPTKNLRNLKDNRIFSQEEYEQKLSKKSLIDFNEKESILRDKEKKKLLFELSNLKEKGIITEEEYLDKMRVIENSYSLESSRNNAEN